MQQGFGNGNHHKPAFRREFTLAIFAIVLLAIIVAVGYFGG